MKSGILGVIGVLMLVLHMQAQSVDTVVSSNYFSEPHGVATDSTNNIYITDGGTGNRILRYTADGAFSVLAGLAGTSGSTDGIGIRARFNDPQGVVSARGGLIIADSGNHLIRFLALSDGTYSYVTNSVIGSLLTNVTTTVTNQTSEEVTNDVSTVITNDTTEIVTNDVSTVVTNDVVDVVTNDVTDVVTNDVSEVVTNDITEVVTNDVTEVVNAGITNYVTNYYTNLITTYYTNYVTNYFTNSVTNFYTNSVTYYFTNYFTNYYTNYFTNYYTNYVTNYFTNAVTQYFTNFVTNISTTYSTNHYSTNRTMLAGTVVTLAGVVSEEGGYSDGIGTGELSYPMGLAVDTNGNIYIADWGNGLIRKLDTNNYLGTVTMGSGIGLPSAVALGDTNDFWVADSMNSVIYHVDSNGDVVLAAGSPGTPGTNDAPFALDGRLNSPRALLWQGANSGLVISDTGNNVIRRLYYNTAADVLDYSLTTVAGVPGQSGLTDGTPRAALFNVPMGLAVDVDTSGFYIADALNRAIRRYRSSSSVVTAVTAPSIGWVKYVIDSSGLETSVFQDITGSSATLYNFYRLAIKGESGVETYMTYGTTPTNSFNDTIPNPSTGSFTPELYRGDGLTPDASADSVVSKNMILSDMTIKAMSRQDGRPSSSIVSARVQFKTATPVIDGNNAAAITLTDITDEADIYYTTNSTIPTNDASSFGPVTNGYVLSIDLKSDLVLKVRAFRPNFQPSEVATASLYVTNYVPSLITFGFNSGTEASSYFKGAAGRRFYAPVTLSLNPTNQAIYTMQYGVFVNSGTAPSVAATYGFDSMLKKAEGDLDLKIDTAMYNTNTDTFESLVLRNPNNNLLMVGWFERYGMTNLYDTETHSLIKYSQAHNTIFDGAAGTVVTGNYYFDIPATAKNGDVYTISLANASGTDINPDTAVVIQSYTNGSFTSGKMNAIKQVTVSSVHYLVGDVEPFYWFNASDFGDSKLQNNDVIQVYQSACYQIHTPPALSDMFDAMDSSDGTSSSNFSADGDTAINAVKTGDGSLLVDDVYVTFRRSLDPSLTNYVRYWSNGVQYAEVITSSATGGLRARSRVASTPIPIHTSKPRVDTTHSVLLRGTDIQITGGKTVNIPITAEVKGGIPMRVFMMDVKVEPLDGAPAVTSSISFNCVENLASSSQMTMSKAAYDFSGAWLNPNVPGIVDTNIIGTLTITFPSTVTQSSAYLIHFDHFSASPNGLAIFPSSTRDTLITVGDRSSSSWNDGISDAWRLRYFGTISNLLSAASADADGDGYSNLAEYLAGTSPVDANSKPVSELRLSGVSADSKPSFTFQWPTEVGAQYSVEYATSITSTNWTVLSSNVPGDGSLKSFMDAAGTNQTRFYRVFRQ